jgi:uncharacterized membrane protein YhhN
MTKKNIWIYLVLFLVTAVDLFMVYTDTGLPRRLLTKPLLMPLLALAYVLETRQVGGPFPKLILGALCFSWLGDVLLMFDTRDEIFFVLGLAAFLTAHLLYILYFSLIKSSQPSFLKKRPLMLLVILAFTVELLYILWPGLGGMKTPVVFYGIVISTMLAFAAWQYGKIQDRAALLFIGGAFLFVLSDSALALNKFWKQMDGGGLFVMFTYVAAQVLIVAGSIDHLSGNRQTQQA